MNRTVRVWKRDGGLHDVNGADAQKADTQKACFLSKPWHYSGRFDDLAVAQKPPGLQTSSLRQFRRLLG